MTHTHPQITEWLGTMAAILRTAEERPLDCGEIAALSRALQQVESALPERPGFAEATDAFCLAVRGSGLLDAGHAVLLRPLIIRADALLDRAALEYDRAA